MRLLIYTFNTSLAKAYTHSLTNKKNLSNSLVLTCFVGIRFAFGLKYLNIYIHRMNRSTKIEQSSSMWIVVFDKKESENLSFIFNRLLLVILSISCIRIQLANYYNFFSHNFVNLYNMHCASNLI